MSQKLAEMTCDEKTAFMQAVGLAMKSLTPKDALFCVILFGDNAIVGDNTYYVSNGKKEDVIEALKEMVDKLEKS